MYYYKFKVFYDEVDDFVRDVDVLANTNFEDFHLFLYQCLGLQGNEFAAFSICDQKWNKQKEITLMDTSEEDEMAEAPEYDDEDSTSSTRRPSTSSSRRPRRPTRRRISRAAPTRRARCR